TSVVGIDTAALPGFIATLLGKPADSRLAAASAATPDSVTLDVLNGTDISGLAGRNAAALRAAGFKVDTIDSTAAAAATLIQYPDGLQAQAKAVAAAVPGAKLILTSTVTRVTLILGGNGVQAAATAPTDASNAGPSPNSSGSSNSPSPPPGGARSKTLGQDC